MSRTNDLVRAFAAGDELAIHRLGWKPIWQALHTWWGRKSRLDTYDDAVPYIHVLGDEDPAAILVALRDLDGEWMPSAKQIRTRIRHGDESRRSVDVGRGRDRGSRDSAYQAAGARHQAGTPACDCNRGPSSVKWRCDPDGVLTCPDCGGIQQGQLFRAEDLGYLKTEEVA